MRKKVLLAALIALSLLFSSCYPELSVQQYDKLKADIAALDAERNELKTQVSTLEAQIKATESQMEATRAKNKQALAYIEFLDRLLSIQTAELVLSGQFDVDTLISSSDNLTAYAEKLGDQDITYYLGLVNSDNATQSVAAYYKAVEYSLKKIRQNLQNSQ